MRRLLLLLALTLAGCEARNAGPMTPDTAPGVSLVAENSDGKAARLQDGPLSITVSGRWQDQGEQTLLVLYTNNGRAAVAIPVTDLALFRGQDRASLQVVLDMTDLNRNDTCIDNDSGVPLFDAETGTRATPLVIKPRETRSLEIGFNRPQTGGPIAADQALTATLPTGGKLLPVQFRADAGGF